MADVERTWKCDEPKSVVVTSNVLAHYPVGAVIRFHGVILWPADFVREKYDPIQNDGVRDIDSENVREDVKGVANII